MAARTERVEARLSAEERQRIRHAAELTGQSVSSFIVGAAVEKAEREITARKVTTVPASYFDQLLAALDEAGPAPALTKAARRRRRIQ